MKILNVKENHIGLVVIEILRYRQKNPTIQDKKTFPLKYHDGFNSITDRLTDSVRNRVIIFTLGMTDIQTDQQF